MPSRMRQIFRLLLGGLDPSSGGLVKRPESECLNAAVDPLEKLSFEATVAQMYRGYENTQRVIQFMDAKAGAVIALCLGIFVLTGKLVVGVYDRLGDGMLNTHQAPVCFMIWGMAAMVVGVGITGFVCLHFAFKSVKPNGLPKPEHFTTLFPAGKQPWANPDLVAYVDKVVTGENQYFILDEFRRQLLAVGDIVYRKIESLKAAIGFLWWQGLFAFLLLVFIGGMVGFGLYPKIEDSPPIPIPVTIVPSSAGNSSNP